MKENCVEIIPTVDALTGNVTIPGSKSLTNRALLIAALTAGQTKITGMLISDDTTYMRLALQKMGVEINEFEQNSWIVNSHGYLKAPSEPLFLGNAGTAMRFLAAAASRVRGTVVLDGDEYMRRRPIGPLIDALNSLGVKSSASNGCPPITINGTEKFLKQTINVDAALSSQYVSALMMANGGRGKTLNIELRNEGIIGGRGYIDLTIAIMKKFGVTIKQDQERRWEVPGSKYQATDYVVEPDASSCTYFWAIDKLNGGSISINLDAKSSIQPDAKSHELFNMFPKLPSVINGSQIQDAVPALAVMAVFGHGEVKFTGIENLRVKECDRIKVLVDGLNKIRKNIARTEGSNLIIQGDNSLIGSSVSAEIETMDDHRMAMSFAIAGTQISGLRIKNPACVGKTFPSFWKELQRIGFKIIIT